MARFCGVVGFAVTNETVPGVWVEEIVERTYYGDVTRNMSKVQTSSYLNDNLNISNEINIVADPYANENFHAIRYVTWMGTKWKVTNVEVKYPRLVLQVGGEYNVEQA